MGMSRAKLGGNSSIQTLWQVGLLLLCPEELYPATPLLYFDVNRISAITKCPLLKLAFSNYNKSLYEITKKLSVKRKYFATKFIDEKKYELLQRMELN